MVCRPSHRAVCATGLRCLRRTRWLLVAGLVALGAIAGGGKGPVGAAFGEAAAANAAAEAAAKAAAEIDPPVTLSLGDDYPPWVDRTLPDDGAAVRIVREALNRGGVDSLEIHWRPWSRAIGEVELGLHDMTFPWVWTEERAERFLFSRPLFVQGDYLYSRPGDPVRTFGDLSGRSLCLPQGYTLIGVPAAMEAAGTLTRYAPNGMDACFRMLLGGRLDAVLSAAGEARAVMQAEGITPADVQRSPDPAHVIPLYVLVGRSNPHADGLMAALNAGLAAMREDGSLRAALPDDF